MVSAGIELPLILHAGRWKSTAMVNRYGERLLARRSGAAQLARMQGAGLSGPGGVRRRPPGYDAPVAEIGPARPGWRRFRKCYRA